MSVLVLRVVAIVLGDSASGAEVPTCLIGNGMGDSLGDSLNMLSDCKAPEGLKGST
jgi:hypothetical protein